MPPEESPEAKFDRLKKQLQDSILRDYPNPERKGCPGDAVLKELADRPLDQPVEDDPHWHHVTHCSECYREFLAFNSAFRQRGQSPASAGWMDAWPRRGCRCAGADFCGAPRMVLFTAPPECRTGLHQADGGHTVHDQSAEAGGDRKPPIVIARKPVDLTVQLPIASPVGPYEFQLRRDKRPVVSASGTAALENGTTSFTVRVDLSKLAPGMYEMSVRKVGWDWGYYPVEIRAD